MSDLIRFLHDNSDGDLLPWQSQLDAAERFNKGIAEIESLALENKILPARYQRNRTMISVDQQHRLFGCCVAVVGCGALGGYVLEQLSRLGVGNFIVIDPDTFQEHNINRQLLASCRNLGQAKVDAAVARIAEINPAVTVTVYQEAYCPDNGERVLRGADIVVDCLDSIDCRLELAKTCTHLHVPMVHGAIAGWYGQISTVFPNDQALEKIYSHNTVGQGIENELGNPAFTPAVVASLETAEVCKVLLGLGTPLGDRNLRIDLLDMEFCELPLK